MRWVVIALLGIGLTVWFAGRSGQPRLLAVSVPTIQGAPPTGALDRERVRRHVAQLGEGSSRVTGSPGAEAAALMILAELRQLGVDERAIETQEFPVTVPIVFAAQLAAGTVRIPLHPLWPNLARTSQTGREGITGPLVDVGSGTDAALAGKPIRGAIVVMDWASNTEWLNVAEMGAQAVIFRANPDGSGTLARNKFLTVPADIPRFYIAASDAPALDAILAANNPSAAVYCEMDWERVPAKNILVRISGADTPRGNRDSDRAPIIFSAYYDSIGVVPDLAPGAEQACSAAALLELGRCLRALPEKPARPVYLLFTAAHGQAMSGMTHFVHQLKKEVADGDRVATSQSVLARMGRPCLMVSLDLSSHSSRFGVFCVGRFRAQPEAQLRPKFSALGLKLDEFAREFAGATAPSAFVDGINLTQGRGWYSYFPFTAGFESELPVLNGFPAVTLATINDERRDVDTPDDRVERVQFPMLERQLNGVPGQRVGLANVALALAFWEGPFVSAPLDDHSARVQGRVAWLDQLKDYTPNQPLAQATVFLKSQRGDKYIVGTRGLPVTMTDEQGRFEFDSQRGEENDCLVEAYGVASSRFVEANAAALRVSRALDGAIIFAADMARPGEYSWRVALRGSQQQLNLVAFPCETLTLYGLTDPRSGVALTDLQILDAATDSPPFQFGWSASDSSWANPEENCLTLWADPSLRVRLTLGHGFQDRRLVLANNTPENPRGVGFGLGDLKTIPSLVLQGGRDMWNLDGSRLRELAANGVRNPRVQQLHDQTRLMFEDASAALQRRDYRAYHAASESGWAVESQAYNDVRETADDLMRGALVYLALLIPFAYALERLWLAGDTVRRRYAGMAAIFTTGFVVLAFAHPAFRFTPTPLIVLLALVILGLAATVTVLLIGRCDGVLRDRVFDKAPSVGTVVWRALDLGIGNIRRHAQRGWLTTLTVALVTFTLLSFTALVPETNISRLRHPSSDARVRGLLMRQRNWSPLPRALTPAVARSVGVVAVRAWYFSDFSGENSQIDLSAVESQSIAGTFPAVALLGLEPSERLVTEVERTLIAGRWFTSVDEPSIILPVHVAKCLGLGVADMGRKVAVFGQELELVGIVDERRFDAVTDIDGEPLTPVNFVMQSLTGAKKNTPSEKADALEQYVHCASDQIAIVPLKLARRFGATLRSVAIRPGAGVDPNSVAESFARRSNQTIIASDGRAVTLFAPVETSRFAAAGHIGVPVVLGFLTVLGTMLGSVVERRREIVVYHAVGLSSRHVASLFLSEAAVYAILGAGLGYLLCQVVAKVLLMTGVLGGLALNYSAGTTVAVLALTMLVVLASSLYPARLAMRATLLGRRIGDEAVGERTDCLEIVLPFVATPANAVAMLAYLHEALDGAQGVTLGRLAVDELRCEVETINGQPCPVLLFRAWLAPFESGVSHAARLGLVHRADRGAYQVQLTATRVSGSQQSWRRLTPQFVTAIRRTLLMWSVLSAEQQASYATKGAELFGEVAG